MHDKEGWDYILFSLPVLLFPVELALDSSLSWGAELKRVDFDVSQLSAELVGRVSNENALASFIRVLPFQFDLGRAIIEAQWAGSEAMWQIGSAEAIRGNKQVQFVAIAKVPKEVEQITIRQFQDLN